MILTIILVGLVAFLYLAGMAVSNEYMEMLEEMDAEQGVPSMPTSLKLLFNITWPIQVAIALFQGGKDAE